MWLLTSELLTLMVLGLFPLWHRVVFWTAFLLFFVDCGCAKAAPIARRNAPVSAADLILGTPYAPGYTRVGGGVQVKFQVA